MATSVLARRRPTGGAMPWTTSDAVAAGARPLPTGRALQVVQWCIAVYAVGSVALIATHRVGLTSEHAILLVLVGAGALPRLRGLVRDWLPFLFIAVMFEDLGAVQPLVAGAVHSSGPAAFERSIFGGVNVAPWLQEHLGGLLGPVWWQLPLVAEYLSHFVAPIAAGAWLWWRYRDRFGGFVAAYMLLMAAGFGVFLLFPEMPPWLAAQQGLIAPVGRVVVDSLQHLGAFGHLYAGADIFPNGAMPSLHVAVPMLIALTLIGARGSGRLRWLWLLYPLSMSFAVVDLGEHYVADAVVGLAFGALCWALVAWAMSPRTRGRPLPCAGAVQQPGSAAHPRRTPWPIPTPSSSRTWSAASARSKRSAASP